MSPRFFSARHFLLSRALLLLPLSSKCIGQFRRQLLFPPPAGYFDPPSSSPPRASRKGGEEELRGLFWSRISPAPLPASLAISPQELLTLANSRPSTFFCFVRSFSSSLLPLRQREDGRGEGESGGTLPSFCLLLPPLSKQLSRKKKQEKGPSAKSKLPTALRREKRLFSLFPFCVRPDALSNFPLFRGGGCVSKHCSEKQGFFLLQKVQKVLVFEFSFFLKDEGNTVYSSFFF